jgi:hypothetical protein
MTSRLYVGNDNLIELIGAQDEVTGSYLNLASCTFSVCDEAGVVIAENIPMSYVDLSNGRYLGTLQSTVSLATGSMYYVEITLRQGELVGRWRQAAIAVDRG